MLVVFLVHLLAQWRVDVVQWQKLAVFAESAIAASRFVTVLHHPHTLAHDFNDWFLHNSCS